MRPTPTVPRARRLVVLRRSLGVLFAGISVAGVVGSFPTPNRSQQPYVIVTSDYRGRIVALRGWMGNGDPTRVIVGSDAFRSRNRGRA